MESFKLSNYLHLNPIKLFNHFNRRWKNHSKKLPTLAEKYNRHYIMADSRPEPIAFFESYGSNSLKTFDWFQWEAHNEMGEIQLTFRCCVVTECFPTNLRMGNVSCRRMMNAEGEKITV